MPAAEGKAGAEPWVGLEAAGVAGAGVAAGATVRGVGGAVDAGAGITKGPFWPQAVKTITVIGAMTASDARTTRRVRVTDLAMMKGFTQEFYRPLWKPLIPPA